MNAPEPHRAEAQVEIEFVAAMNTAIVKLRGEHDLGTQARFRWALAEAGGKGRVLIDLSECTFADSSLIAAISNARQELPSCRLEVVIPPDAAMIRRLAVITRLAEIVPISTSVPDRMNDEQ